MDTIELGRYIVGGIILALALTGFVYKVKRKAEKPLGWLELVLVGLAVFVIFGETVTRIALSPKGLTIEQQVESFERQAARFPTLAATADPDDLQLFLEEATGRGANVWGRMVLYRSALRALVRAACERHEIPVQGEASISSMLSGLRSAGIIEEELFGRLDRLRNATYAAQWGRGEPPTASDVRWVLEKGPDVLRELQQAAH